MTIRSFVAALWLLVLPTPASAQDLPVTFQSEFTRTTLVTEHTAITSGASSVINAALLLEPAPGWHTYWENPGDAGLPISLTWELPKGFSAGSIDWPAPKTLMEGPLMTHSYDSTVFLPVAIAVPEGLEKGRIYPIKLKAEWLICKEICVPDSSELQISLPVAEGEPEESMQAYLFTRHREQRPVTLDTPGSFTSDGDTLTLSLSLDTLKSRDIKGAHFFMREQNLIQYPAEQKLTVDDNTLHLALARADDPPGEVISGILALTGSDGSLSHYNLSFTAATATASGQELWFPVAMLLAVLGGLVLNLMPCVLPVLSLKALALAKKAGAAHEHVVRQGVAYTAGILVSFGIIAGVLIALRQAGEAVGWGYQMQSPAFVGFLAYLLFLVGLNLSGFFHLPVLLGNVGMGMANESSARGSFFTGILATAVATPCTAPFMASAVGAALTMPAWQALLVFEALGLGLALPFLLISLFPRLRRFLPRPGAWMDTFKQLLAFPMYASVIWLLWVLALQTGAGGMAVALSGMLVMVLALWMKPLFTESASAYRWTALAIFAGVLLLSLPALRDMENNGMAMPDEHMRQGVTIMPYSQESLAALRKEGKPVFVDATAAWCITCQVNARIALHTENTMKEFKVRGITLMIADWTRRNDQITEFLSGFGYKGVPLYVFYPGNNGKPIVLPQILTEDIVIKTIKGE